MQAKVVDGVAEDGFLNEEDVAFCFLDLFDYVKEVFSLFF